MSTSGAARPFSNGGKRSNEKPSSKDAACNSRKTQPEPPNQMSQTYSQIAKPTARNALTTYSLDDVDAHLAENREHILDLLGIDLLRGQHRVDLVMGGVATLLCGADELLDGRVR